MWRVLALVAMAVAAPTPPVPHSGVDKSTDRPDSSYSYSYFSYGDPMGKGWGLGCSNMCDENFVEIKEKFDDFAT